MRPALLFNPQHEKSPKPHVPTYIIQIHIDST